MIKPLDCRGTWRSYSIADGLAGVQIEHIAEDGEGNLWFATYDNGVSRFDGDVFCHFTTQDGLLDNRVFVVHNDSGNRLWFGTSKGVCWYDGTDFHRLEGEGISGRAVQFIYEDRVGRVWFGGSGTLGYYRGAEFHDLIPIYLRRYGEAPAAHHRGKQCRGIAQDPEGHIWFGFDYLIRFDGTSFYRYGEKEGLPQAWHSYAVAQDHAGGVWVGHHRLLNGLRYYAEGGFQPIQVDLGGRLRKIQSDREGRMWFCTSEGVLFQDGDSFSRFTPANGLPHSAVKAVFQDRAHQLWFATWNGVGIYDAHSISVFEFSAESLRRPSEISRIVQDCRGHIWIGFMSPVFQALPKSVFRFDGEHMEFVSAEDGGDINNCFDIYEDHDGRLWIGGRRGLYNFDGRNLRKVERLEV